MSRIRANQITNQSADGAPTVQHGLIVSGVTTVTTLDLNGDLDVDGHLNADNVSIAGVVTATSFVGSGSNLTGITQTTINNNADNRLITGSGTANTLNGESNLTFDGTQLSVTGSGTPPVYIGGANPGIKFEDTNASGTPISYIYASDGQLSLRADDGNETGSSHIEFKVDGSERLRIDSSGHLLHGVTADEDTSGSGGLRFINTGDIQIDGDQKALVFRSTNSTAQLQSGIEWWNENGAGVQAKILCDRTAVNKAPGDIVFYTNADVDTSANNSEGDITERLRIKSDGKFFKGGNQFYPLVNYVEVASFSGVNVSSSSYTDLRTIYSGYSPKKAGNRIVIHHQSQMWNGASGQGNGDVYWRIQKDEGSGWGTVIANERILGNHDGWNNSGGYSGLARHHRTVHLMGSFICNGNNFNLKTQGRSMGIGWDWYHDANNILQIWEYELS